MRVGASLSLQADKATALINFQAAFIMLLKSIKAHWQFIKQLPTGFLILEHRAQLELEALHLVARFFVERQGVAQFNWSHGRNPR